MRVNLKNLYADLAKMDVRKGYNASIVETEVAVAALGKLLRSVGPEQALAILSAITERAGKK